MTTPTIPQAAAGEERSFVTEIATGLVRGARAGEAIHWAGIPYVAPPVGPRRFGAPQPAEPWSGTRDCTLPGPTAPQFPALRGRLAGPLSARRGRGEDCLSVNVWAPATTGEARAVVVWFHGGSFNSGSGSGYDCHELVEQGDVVCVTVNYRLGGLGFVNFFDMFEEHEQIVSNPGVRDQIAALQWVRDNIAAFGGDPSRVTIAGESAGSACVTALSTAPAARGLFHGVIAQSGALTLTVGREDAGRNARAIADQLQISCENVDELWRVPASTIIRATAKAQSRRVGGLLTRPWWDGDVLPASLAEAYDEVAPVPLLIGSNHDEHRVFTKLKRDVMPLTRAHLGSVIGESFGWESAKALLGLYPQDADGLNDLGSDLIFRMPGVHLGARVSREAPNWQYRFDHGSQFFGWGAFHAIELMHLFPSTPRLDRVMLGPPSPELTALGQRFRTGWLNFVRDGNPGADWPAYDTTTRTTRLFDLQDTFVDDPDSERRKMWAGRDTTAH